MTAFVTAGHLAALKAFLTGDDTTFDRISAQLDASGSWQAYAVLQGAAFTRAARRRFPGGYQAGDVIRFVGKVRADAHDETGRIDPGTAERLLRAALSDSASVAGLDQSAMALAMAALLKTLIAQDRISGPELDAFLAESRSQAARVTGS